MARWRGRHVLLGVALVAYFFTLFARLVISPVVPDIIETYRVSKSEIGLALTAMWAAFALIQYPGGILGDRYGEKPVILGAILVTGFAGLLVAIAPTYAAFVVVVVLLGIGAGLYPPSGTSLLAKRFRRTGQALGLHVAGANLAGLVAPVAAAYVAVRYGWRAAPLLVVALTVPVFVLFATGVRPTTPSRPDVPMRERFTVGALSAILSRRTILFTTLIGIIGQFTFGAVASFLPTFLIEFWGLGTEHAGAVFGVVYLFSAMTMPLTGRLSDIVGRDLAIAVSLSLATAGLALLLFGRGTLPAIAAVVVLGTGISWGGTVHSRFMDHLADAERGTGFGLVRTVTGLVGSTGSVVVGALADLSGWTAAWGVVITLLVLAVLLLGSNRVLRLGL